MTLKTSSHSLYNGTIINFAGIELLFGELSRYGKANPVFGIQEPGPRD